jgi:hypothetical protein
MSSELIPQEVVLLMYRRYLKAAIRVPNQVIRSLLLQQIRKGFRQHMHMRSALAQRECIAQAQKDLQILEDERHARTLYINRFGAISCLEWELRRTEWYVSPTGQRVFFCFAGVMFSFFAYIAVFTQRVEEFAPDITQTVDLMAMKLEVDNPQQLWEKRERDMQRQIDTAFRVRSLEERILSTFDNSPVNANLPLQPTLTNPNGSVRNLPAHGRQIMHHEGSLSSSIPHPAVYSKE